MKKTPKIGLALSGGLAKGFAHIGVLKVLEEHSIPLDYISGTSIGAIIGGLYCSGLSLAQIEEFSLTTEWHPLFNFTVPRNYLIRKFAIRNLIRKLTQNKSFNQLNPPLFISGTRLKDGQEIIFHKGDLTKAIMASISLPGILKPENIDHFSVVDGGLVNPVPVSLLEKKCDKIIAVDASSMLFKEQLLKTAHVKDKSKLVKELKEDLIKTEINALKDFFKHKKFKKIPNFVKMLVIRILSYMFTPAAVIDLMVGRTPPEITETILQSYTIVMSRLSELTFKSYKTDVIIKPKSKYLGWFEFDKAKDFIKAGELATKEKLVEIKKLLK